MNGVAGSLPFNTVGKRLVVETAAIENGCRSTKSRGGLTTDESVSEVELVSDVVEFESDGLMFVGLMTKIINANETRSVAMESVGHEKNGCWVEVEKRR
jgi:hypothetical protein